MRQATLKSGKFFSAKSFGILLLLGAASLCSADSLVVGVDNGGNRFPFSGPQAGYAGTEYQEAYASSNFTDGPILITGIEFFVQSGLGGNLWAGTYTLSFSTITAGIGDLSSTDLASNLGPDNTLFASATLSGVAPNTLVFTADTPFYYDPSQRNLLLDIAVTNATGASAGVWFEDEDGAGDGLNVVRYSNFGSQTTGYGLVTQFDFEVAPEPSTLALLGGGLAAMIYARRRSHSKKIN